MRGAARLPERVEVAAYYVVAEALTNAAKHAHASVVHVEALGGTITVNSPADAGTSLQAEFPLVG